MSIRLVGRLSRTSTISFYPCVSLRSGDFAEVPETCPAMTTCPVVCVSSLNDCPTACRGNTTLCANGSCQEECTGYKVAPCGCPSLPLACPKVVDYYDECFTSFQTFYDAKSACLAEQVYPITPASFSGPYFLSCYIWISTVTVLVLGWCYFNEKLCPYQELTCVSIPMCSSSGIHTVGGVWTQTGYKRTFIGTTIYLLVLLTVLGIQVLLGVMVVLYYVQVGAITRWTPAFSDLDHFNKTFIMVWIIGFLWTIVLYCTPNGINNLFLRRCPLAIASCVSIASPTSAQLAEARGSVLLVTFVRRLTSPIGKFLCVLFSCPNNNQGNEVLFCPVHVDKACGQRGLYHHLRKYVWSESAGAYIDGRIIVGDSLQDFMNQGRGLCSSEVTRRISIVGPNTALLEKPTVFSSLRKEFSRTFYVYQNFFLWLYLPYFFFYSCLGVAAVRVMGGCISAYFYHTSEVTLYRASKVDGIVKYVQKNRSPVCLLTCCAHYHFPSDSTTSELFEMNNQPPLRPLNLFRGTLLCSSRDRFMLI
jgi:hypothetical protein